MERWPEYDEVGALPQGERLVVPAEYGDDNGHLNVRHYLGLFDDGEEVLLSRVGLGTDLARRGIGGVFALEQHLTYRREVGVADEVSVGVRVVGRTERMIHLVSYLANHTKREVAASLEALDAYVDLDTRRLAAMPEDPAAALDRLVTAAEALPWEPELSGTIRPG
jgi:acyl-CoA thioester hydrolase